MLYFWLLLLELFLYMGRIFFLFPAKLLVPNSIIHLKDQYEPGDIHFVCMG